MSRFKPEDIGLPEDVRVDKRDSTIGLHEFNVRIKRTEHICPRCKRTMIGYGTYVRKIRHYHAEISYLLYVFVPRSYCKKCRCTISEDISFASRICPSVSLELEEHVLRWLKDPVSILSICKRVHVSFGAIQKLIEAVHIKQVHLKRSLLMDEIHAYTWREDNGRRHPIFWAVAYDAEDTCVLDIINGKDGDAIQAFYDSISLSDKMKVRHFCCDMEDTYIAKGRANLPQALICVDKFHIAKDGCKHFTEARCQLQKGAGNGADIKCMANKLVANRCRRLSHISASAYESEKRLIAADMLCVCDAKHAKLRLAYMALQLYYLWQDTTFETIDDMEHALNGLIGRISTIPIPQMKRFAKSLSKYKREILRGYFYNVNNVKAEALNRKIKDIKRVTNGMHNFDVARKRILIALGREGATEGGSAYIIRKERAKSKYALKTAHI